MLDTPVHVNHAPQEENSVSVKGGTNWIPQTTRPVSSIKKLEDPAPSKEDIAKTKAEMPSAVVEYLDYTQTNAANYMDTLIFSKDCWKLSHKHVAQLRKIPKDKNGYLVIGHARPDEKNPVELSEKRAANIARVLLTFNKGPILVKEPGLGSSANSVIEAPYSRGEIYKRQ